MQRVKLAGLTPTGFQAMSLANSTSIAVNSTVRASSANLIVVSVETQSARMRCDGSAPTLTTGVLLTAANGPYIFDLNPNSAANWKFQRSTGTCVVSVQGFRRGPA